MVYGKTAPDRLNPLDDKQSLPVPHPNQMGGTEAFSRLETGMEHMRLLGILSALSDNISNKAGGEEPSFVLTSKSENRCGIYRGNAL